MPTSVITAVIAGAVPGLFASTGWAFAWGSFASSLVLNGVSRALQKKPQAAQQASLTSQGRLVNIRQPISSWQIVAGQARVGGVITFAEVVSRAGGKNNVLNLVITLAGHVSEEAGDIYFNDEVVPLDGSGSATGRYAGYVGVTKSLGAEAGQPFPDLVASWSDGKWTDAHRQSGRTKIWIRLVASPDLFPTGLPVITVIVKGAKIYDTRTSTTVWSANAALWCGHYLAESTYGLGTDYDDEIDSDDLDASANICDEAVTLDAGGDEDRYTVNGAFLVSERPQDVLERLLGAMAGRAVNHGAMWHIYAGAWYAPTVTLDESDLAGPIRVQSLVSRRENCNGVKGIFTDPDSSWQPTDFPALASATYLAEDNNERVWRDVDYSAFVTSGTQAQRLAKIELLRTRQPLTVAALHKLTAFGVVPGRTVAIDNTKFGFSAKAFDVERSVFVVGDDGALNVDLAYRETAEAIYDWDTSEEQTVDIAPNSTLPDPWTVEAPGTLTVTEEIYETTGSAGVKARAVLTWTALDGFSTAYSVEYKLAADSTYTVAPTVNANSAYLDDLAPGTYNFRHRAISTVTGVRSAYSAVVTKEILGFSAAPAVPVILGLQPSGDGTRCTLTLQPAAELDVRRGGRWLVRHYEGDSPDPSTGWQFSFSIGEAEGYVGDQTILSLPLKPGAYLVKAEDFAGHQSADFASVVTKQASLFEFSVVNTLTEDTAFAGSKSNMVAVDSLLKLTGAGLFDDIDDFDSISSLDDYGGVEASGTYTFTNAFNFGAVTRVRITGQITGQAVNVNDLIDDRDEDIDDWLDFDGDSGGGSVDAWLEYRQTDDNPAGAPTWSDWLRLDSAAVEAWGVQCRLRAISSDPAYNVHINQLRAVAEQVV